jgi:hypothetical protein
LLLDYLKRTLAIDCRNLTYLDAYEVTQKIKFKDIIEEPILDESDVQVGTRQVFPYEISETNLWLLAHGMVISWLLPKINRERLLRESLGDRDYKESSHGNQLQQLMKLLENAKHEIEVYQISISHDDFEGFN